MSRDPASSQWSMSGGDSHHLLAGVLQLLPDAVLVLDATGNVMWANEATELLFGVALEDAEGRSAVEFIHPDDIELVLRSLESVQAKESGTLIELRARTAQGWTLVEVIGRCAPEFGEGNIVFCIRDVTERRRFEVASDDVAKFRSLVQYSASVTMLISDQGIIESVSAALTRLFSYDPEAVEGLPLVDLFIDRDRYAIERALANVKSETESVSLEVSCVRFGRNEVIPAELTIVSLLDDPVVHGYVVSMHDVSERTRAVREMRETLSLLAATLESTADGILVVDRSGRIVRYNHQFVQQWNIPDAILRTRDDAKAVAHVTSQLTEPDEFLSKVAELYSSPSEESFDVLTFTDGRVFERYSRPQRVGDEIVGRVWSFRDVTDQKTLEESLSHRAYHDALTGLGNQALFLEKLHQAIQDKNPDQLVAVFFIDVDHLKLVNDRFGHVIGDRILVQVADVLRLCIGESCTIARLGGDEFAVLAEGLSNRREAGTLAAQILDAFARTSMELVASSTIEGSLSIGIAFHEEGLSDLELLHNADVAMYAAKRKGKGRWERYLSTSEADID